MLYKTFRLSPEFLILVPDFFYFISVTYFLLNKLLVGFLQCLVLLLQQIDRFNYVFGMLVWITASLWMGLTASMLMGLAASI